MTFPKLNYCERCGQSYQAVMEHMCPQDFERRFCSACNDLYYIRPGEAHVCPAVRSIIAESESVGSVTFPWEAPLSPSTEMIKHLKSAFPYGHEEFIPILVRAAELHSNKNHDYASGGSALGNFERVAAILAQYPGLPIDDPVVVMLIYALKQVDAVLWGFAQGIEHKVEGPIERLNDILVYAGIAMCALKDRAREDKSSE